MLNPIICFSLGSISGILNVEIFSEKNMSIIVDHLRTIKKVTSKYCDPKLKEVIELIENNLFFMDNNTIEDSTIKSIRLSVLKCITYHMDDVSMKEYTD